MSAQTFIEHKVVTDDVDEVLDRLSDEKHVKRHLANVLNEAARLGEHSAQIYSPTGATHKLRRHIESEMAHPSEPGWMQAKAGITRMEDERDPERGAYPHTGTGRYGESGQDIVPRTGRFMVFEFEGRLWVLPRVKGQEPQRFFRDAYEDVTEYLPQRLELMARQIVESDR